MTRLPALLVLAVLCSSLALALSMLPDAGIQVSANTHAPARAVDMPYVTTTTVPPTTTTAPRYTKRQRVELFAANTGRCGGDLPPCWVMMRESGGDINAYNPDGCSGRGCFGKWQCDPRTCDGTGTEEEQDAEARRVWDNGRGCAHWNAC